MLVTTTDVGRAGRLTAYQHDDSAALPAERPAVLVLPGGGYQHCSDREAEPVALGYLAAGFTAFVLRYSVGPEATFDDAYTDATAALSHIRDNAGPYGIPAHRLAVVGFSAGGHLAASLGTLSEHRPDALVLGYPVTLAPFGERMHTPIPDVAALVDAETPPTFLFSTQSDQTVPVEHSLVLCSALARAGVVFESHIYATGPHGLALALPVTATRRAAMVDPDVAQWLGLSVRFLHKLWGDFPVE